MNGIHLLSLFAAGGLGLVLKRFYFGEPKIDKTQLFHDCCEVSEDCECMYGFKRPDFKKDEITGRVVFHTHHIFICSGQKSTEWKSHVEQEGFAAQLNAALLKHRKQIRVQFSFIEEESTGDGTDILIFPDMIRYNNLKDEHVNDIVDHFLKGPVEKLNPKKFSGTHVFVCCHHSRDKRCSTCGPRLFKEFYEKIEKMKSTLKGLHENCRDVYVRRSSHLGAHKFAGNVVIYRYSEEMEKWFGDWFGYVALDDVERIIKNYIVKGKLGQLKDIWRGRCNMKNTTAQAFLKFQ